MPKQYHAAALRGKRYLKDGVLGLRQQPATPTPCEGASKTMTAHAGASEIR